MLIIESNLIVFSTSSWILDSGLSAYICTSMQGLVDSRGLKHSEMILWVSNGARIAAEAIEIYPLRLLSDFRLVLKDCYYILVASWNLIFVYVLVQKNFTFNFNKDFYLIYL